MRGQPLDSSPSEVILVFARNGEALLERGVVIAREGVEPRRVLGGIGHRRRMPRMLTKKLERTVWNPSAVNVAPGITHRIVWL